MSMPGAAPPRAARRGRRTAALLVAALVVVALVAAGIAGGTRFVSKRAGVVEAGVAPRYPDAWDPRVVDLVAFTERERGLTFKHPVFIDFLDDATYRKEVSHSEALDEEEKAELKSEQALLRAVGLLSGDVDLLTVSNELAGEGTAGAYVPEIERILVRGTNIGDGLRLTLVHELTHALQDQHFDIGRYDYEELTSGEAMALSAIEEADATEVEDAWLQSLPSATQEAVMAAEEAMAEAVDLEGVPEVFAELSAFPYEFGPDFLYAVLDKEGEPARNRLFTEPPTTEEHILLPETYLSRQVPQEVKVPALGDGEKVVEGSESDFGMLSLLVMLAERIDFGVAWPAVHGWAGDSSVAFERAGTTCVRADVLFDQPAQAERFAGAFAQWARNRPATHTRNDRSVLFESCDPGVAAAGGRPDGHISGVQGLGLRAFTIDSLEEQGAPPDVAICVADGLIDRLGANRLAEIDEALTADPEDPALLELERTVTSLASGCE